MLTSIRSIFFSKRSRRLVPAWCLVGLFSLSCLGKPDPRWLDHDRTRPLPAVVDPGTSSTPQQPGRGPSDAVVLFDGGDLSQWAAMNGEPTRWIIKDGAMECVPGSGIIRSRQCFGDCQLHVEWATPANSNTAGQGHGNSGVFLGLDRYEIQVLGSYGNTTYADGSAGSIYGQYPPLVNASRPDGQWQAYDIIWKAPHFDADGNLVKKAHLTVFHNGVLIQDNVELTGPTSWLERAPYEAHPVKLPIAFQDHGNPIRFRNVWIRELGNPGKPEFLLPDALLDSYTGEYQGKSRNVEISRASDGRLNLKFVGINFLLSAQSDTRFFAKTTDVQCQFSVIDGKQTVRISVGEDGGDLYQKLP